MTSFMYGSLTSGKVKVASVYNIPSTLRGEKGRLLLETPQTPIRFIWRTKSSLASYCSISPGRSPVANGLIMFSEILLRSGRIRLHAISAFFPVRRANFSIFLMKLQRIDHSQGFIGISSQRKIVDELVLNHTILVDQK